MDVKLLQERAISTVLQELIRKHDEFHWAVAWGSMTDAAKLLLKHPLKHKAVTFGIAFCQTDPDLIDGLAGIDGARIATEFPGGTYHPKVYCFRSGAKAAAVVGSANFTAGGLGKNHEASVLVEGNAADPFFIDLFDFIKRSASFGQPVTAELAAAYRISHKLASRLPRAPLDPIDSLSKDNVRALSSPLITMDWDEYVRRISASKYHNKDESLRLLRIAQQWFASVPSYSELSLGQRQAIAGLIVDKTQRADPSLNLGWGWFGAMKGMGEFASLINANDRHIARAIDSVPQKGLVSKQHFETFATHFKRAFQGSNHVGGYATASRLLAMKRPDTFICICGPNILEASEKMKFARTTLTLSDYWDKVVKVVRMAEWYNAEKPDNPDGELWENRVAMLDAIFYRPS